MYQLLSTIIYRKSSYQGGCSVNQVIIPFDYIKKADAEYDKLTSFDFHSKYESDCKRIIEKLY